MAINYALAQSIQDDLGLLKAIDQLSAVVLISVRSCLFRLEFHFNALLIKLYNS